MKKKIEQTALAAVMSGKGIGNAHLSEELDESISTGRPKRTRRSREQRESQMERGLTWRDLIGL